MPGEKARGRAHAGVSVLNAIATHGIGGALPAPPLELVVEAKQSPGPEYPPTITLYSLVDPGERVLSALRSKASQLGLEGEIVLSVDSSIPWGMGFKSSHAFLGAVLEVLYKLSHERTPRVPELALETVSLARLAGLTVTGALDDALAALGDRVYITNNVRDAIIASHPIPRGYRMVLCEPLSGERRHVSTVAPRDYEGLQAYYREAVRLVVERGDWLGAMRLNAYATLLAYEGSGSSLARWVRGLLESSPGVVAGLSGKGPGFFVLAPGGFASSIGCPSGYRLVVRHVF